MNRKCEINPCILRYIDLVESGTAAVCADQIKLAAHVRRCFENEELYTDAKQLEK